MKRVTLVIKYLRKLEALWWSNLEKTPRNSFKYKCFVVLCLGNTVEINKGFLIGSKLVQK